LLCDFTYNLSDNIQCSNGFRLQSLNKQIYCTWKGRTNAKKSIELLYNNNSINYHWMHFKFRQ